MGIRIVLEQTRKIYYVRYNNTRYFPIREEHDSDLPLTYDDAIMQIYKIKRDLIKNIKILYHNRWENKVSWKKFKRSFFNDTKVYIKK